MVEKECQDKIIVDGVNIRLIKTFEHPNCGIYAVEIEDAQNRHWIVLPEDIEEPEFMVDDRIYRKRREYLKSRLRLEKAEQHMVSFISEKPSQLELF